MIYTEKNQGIVGMNQISLINHMSLIKMIVIVEEISIGIGMKQPTNRNNNSKIRRETHLILKIHEMINTALMKVTLNVI